MSEAMETIGIFSRVAEPSIKPLVEAVAELVEAAGRFAELVGAGRLEVTVETGTAEVG